MVVSELIMKISKLSPTKLIMALTAMCSTNASATNLCATQEKVHFSCRLNGGKYVSICSSADRKRLSYRFGHPARIELEHSDNLSKNSSFFYAALHSATMEAFHLGFIRQGHRYTVHRDTDRESSSSVKGLRVEPLEKPSLELTCKDDVDDDNFYKLTNLPCDPEMVLGCSHISGAIPFEGL